MSEPATVIHSYHAAYNAITEPDKFVACSRYFVRRWMPALGDNGTRIVLALRSLGYYNRETGERRDGIEIELLELAALIGIHTATLKREFGDKKGMPGVPQNPVLSLFVRKEQQYWRDPVTNRLLRTANIYRVMMDDPVHPDDMSRLNELLAERDKSDKSGAASKAQNAPQMPRTKQSLPSKAHSALNKVQSALNKVQSESESTHFALPEVQNAPALIDYSKTLLFTSNPSEDAPAAPADFSLSLFEEEGSKEKNKEAKEEKTWADLSPEEQRPYRGQAKSELHKYAVEAGAARWARIGPRQEDVRARGIYEKSQKRKASTED